MTNTPTLLPERIWVDEKNRVYPINPDNADFDVAPVEYVRAALIDTARPTCEYCEQGSKPWQKNGVWVHEGGVACSTARPTEQDAQVAQSDQRELAERTVQLWADYVTAQSAPLGAFHSFAASLIRMVEEALRTSYVNGVRQGAEAEQQRNPDAAPCVGQGHEAGFCYQCRRYYD